MLAIGGFTSAIFATCDWFYQTIHKYFTYPVDQGYLKFCEFISHNGSILKQILKHPKTTT